jgi:hypothetical protein
VFNTYKPPPTLRGDASQAAPWVEHVRRIYPNEVEHIFDWMAYRIQYLGEKINHCLVLGGAPGIGKDALVAPLKHAIGYWNFLEVDPQAVLGMFNSHVQCLVLRINESRDLGEFNKYKFYDHTKVLMAAPPDELRCRRLHQEAIWIPNVVAIIITTNHRDALFLTEDDRRHFVCWSEAKQDDWSKKQWDQWWQWHNGGGYEHVAAWLRGRDVSRFNSKAPPPKTDAFWSMVDAGRAPECDDISDIVEQLGRPDALTIAQVQQLGDEELRLVLQKRWSGIY